MKFLLEYNQVDFLKDLVSANFDIEIFDRFKLVICNGFFICKYSDMTIVFFDIITNFAVSDYEDSDIKQGNAWRD